MISETLATVAMLVFVVTSMAAMGLSLNGERIETVLTCSGFDRR